MAGHLAAVDGPSDGELISAVRAGDSDAYGELFARHVEAARRLARQLVSAGEADDLVSEAFAKVLVVLRRGGGPDLAFRAYLLTAVRRLHVDRIRSTARLRTTDDLTPFDPGVPFRDTAVEGFESATAARAFASLPERWQLVLWHTEVEGQKPAEVGRILGMSANSVSALAYRAREGLRRAYLSLHAQDVDDDACTWTRAQLGGYLRGGLSRRDQARVEQHLEECRRCAAIYLELSEVNSRLGAVIAPLLLGAAATAYLGTATGGGAAASGGLVLLLDRAKDAVLAHGPTAAVTGAAASAVAVGLLVTVDRTEPMGPGAEGTPEVRAEPFRVPGGPVEHGSAPRPTRPPATSEAPARGGAPPGSAAAPAADTAADPAPAVPASPPEPAGTTPPSGTPSDIPSGPPPAEPPSEAPVVHLAVEASVAPEGVGVGVDAGVLGIELADIEITIPAGVGSPLPG